MSLERNTVVERILQSIDHGRLPPAQTEKRLHALIEQETDRTDGPADTALIDGCLALLEQLHAPAKAPEVPGRPARRFVCVCKWAAVAAVVLLLVLGVTDKLRWQWYDHGTSADGEQHIITGHEVKVDVIQKAIAEHWNGAQAIKFASVADMERHLGFNPGIPDRLADAYEPASIDVSIQSDRIMFLVAYRSDAEPDGSISLNVGCYVNLNDVSVTAEEAEVGEICLIGGCSVYVSHSADHEVAQWMNGNTCFVLRTAQNAASVTDHVREIIGCGIAPDSGTGTTADQIAASIQRNMSYDMQPLQTEDFGALCEYLGFVPDLIRPEAIGADSAYFSASTTPAFLRIVVHYRDADDNTMVHFSGAYYSSMEDAIFAFEESKEGEFIQIGGRSVYTTMNFGRRVYSWTEDLSICYISTQMNHDAVVAMLEDYFAGSVIERTEAFPLTGVTANQIAASIQRNMSHPAEQLRTEEFGELCDYLGFVPDLIRPEVIGADSVIFTSDAARFSLQVNASYLDADGKTMALFDSVYYSSMEEARYTFEESEKGEFIQIGSRSVYSTKNYDWQVYSWTEDIRVCSIATRMNHDDVLAMLEEYFAGSIIGQAEASSLTDVTAEQIAASIQRNMGHTAAQLETNEFGELCDYLGFAPDIIQPEAIGADSVLFIGTTAPVYLLADTVYRDADGHTMAIFTCTYYSSMEEVWYTFEESEAGEYIRIGDRSVYSTRNYDWRVYSWTDGLNCCCFSTRMAHDDAVALLEDYFAGSVIVRKDKAPLTGVTAEEIQECIDRNQVHRLCTTDFGEVCNFLGFAPVLIRPEALNAASVEFTAMTSPDLVRIDVVYSDADGNQLGMLSNLCFPNPEDVYFSFEESGGGQHIRIGGKEVYRTVNIDETVFHWASGSTVCNLYWQQDSEPVLSVLEDFFAGSVIVREDKVPLTGVTVEEIWDSAQKLPVQEGQHLRTSDYAKVCEFLGFAPEIIRPEMLDAVRIDFYAEFLPDCVSLDAYYCDAEGYSNHFSIRYYTEPDMIPYRVEENENGQFIDICGQQVYTALQGTTKAYRWRFDKGVCDFYCDAKSDLPLPALEAYLSGDVLTSEAASQLPTDATPQQIAAIIAEQETRQISTGDFREFCDSLGFTPAVFRPEVFHAREVLYNANVMPDWTVVGTLYQPEDREYNVVMQISYFASVDEVFANFEQSENGVFLNIAGTTVYCAPNLPRTSYAWVDGTVTYLLSGVLPQETTIPLLEAYLLGDRQLPGN